MSYCDSNKNYTHFSFN